MKDSCNNRLWKFWDKLFKKANRNEYTSVSEMNEVFKHAGYRIETGGRIMGDGKVRLYKTDSDGNEAVVLEEELGENGLAPVRKYLSNNIFLKIIIFINFDYIFILIDSK